MVAFSGDSLLDLGGEVDGGTAPPTAAVFAGSAGKGGSGTLAVVIGSVVSCIVKYQQP